MNIGVSGHQDIPEEAIAFVRQGITNVLSSATGDLVGVASLAAGADQLFASIIFEHGGRLHVIIPSKGYERTFSDPNELSQFRCLLNKADVVETLSYQEPSEEAFLAAGRRVVDASNLLLAVWDGKPAQGKGGTADIVEYARKRGTRVEVIWPPQTSR
ncbi:MAG TPA: hypothetical protein VMZ30_05485 [Pyrinomonadaceae bacterium]|nr:hypothetical protein [Pyrinomonadaceae bacterium]